MSMRAWVRMPMAAAVMVAAVGLLGLGTVVAQAPPTPPHQFFGSVSTGSGASLDGVVVENGAVITVVDAQNAAVKTATVTGGTWTIQVDSSEATTVSFRIGDSTVSQAFTVSSGELTEVTLDLSSEVPPPATTPPATTPPAALPNGGSGGIAGLNGIAGTSALLALVLLGIGVVAAVSVVGVRLSRRSSEFD